jgi:riboflavin biosynthesis pyrimidine reductase
MISSVDGSGVLGGRTGGLSGPGDRILFTVLRSLADVILVGAGTARAERYRPVRRSGIWPGLRSGRDPTPPVAVLTRLGEPLPARMLRSEADRPARTIVVTSSDAPRDRLDQAAAHADVIVAGTGPLTASQAVAALADRGYRQILVEGGPTLLGQLAAEDALDELCVTISPLLAGGPGGRILAPSGEPPAQGLAVASPLARLRVAHVLYDEGFLLCRYLREPNGSHRAGAVRE